MSFFKLFLLILFATYFILLLSILLSRFLHKRRTPPEEEEPLDCSPDSDYPLIELLSVQKSFDHPVLTNVSFGVECGQTLGVLGKSGTGKSVLLKLMAGFLQPDSGMILFRGRDITKFSEQQLLELRKKVSYVFQGGAVFDFLNVRENIAYPLRERGIVDDDLIKERVDYLLDAVELEGMGDMRQGELSVGAKKQVAIARAIAMNPQVILYDEPTTGVDPIIGKSLSRLIRKLSKQENLTSIVVTHDLRCLEMVSDEIILLKDGVIHFKGSVEDFESSEDSFVDAFRTGKRFTEGPPAVSIGQNGPAQLV